VWVEVISHKHKFIFVHIPKCGGTSVELALLKNEGVNIGNYSKRHLGELSEEYRQKYRLGYDYEGISVQHRHIDQYKDEKEKKYFTFSFVRNPWDKLVSEYFYIRKFLPYSKCNETEFNLKYKTFEEFVRKAGMVCAWPRHEDPQINFILNYDRNKLVEFVGKCEDMKRDFDYVCDKIGIPPINLPHRNKTKHKHYTEYYDDETRQIVAEKYDKDIEYFGYEFGE
jgi:hypothetical protein